MTQNCEPDYCFFYGDNDNLLSVHVYHPEPFSVGTFYRYPGTLLGRLRMAWRLLLGVSPLGAKEVASEASARVQEWSDFSDWRKSAVDTIEGDLCTLIRKMFEDDLSEEDIDTMFFEMLDIPIDDRGERAREFDRVILNCGKRIMKMVESLAYKPRPF